MRVGDERGDQTDQEDAGVDDQEQPAHDRPTEAGLPALFVDDPKAEGVLADARAGSGRQEHEIEGPMSAATSTAVKKSPRFHSQAWLPSCRHITLCEARALKIEQALIGAFR